MTSGVSIRFDELLVGEVTVGAIRDLNLPPHLIPAGYRATSRSSTLAGPTSRAERDNPNGPQTRRATHA
jgi:hypothetical protein